MPFEPEVGARSRATLVSGRSLVAISFGLVLGATRSITWPATVLVVVLGVVVGLAGRSQLTVATAAPEGLDAGAVAPWVAVFLIFCLWELAAFLLGNNESHPTFSMLTEGVLGWYPTRAAAAAVWVLLGWEVVDL